MIACEMKATDEPPANREKDSAAMKSSVAKARPYRAFSIGATLLFLVAILDWRPGHAEEELKSGVLHFGFSKSFFQGVNENDAQAAFKAAMLTIGRKRGYNLKSTSKIFDDRSALETAIKTNALHMAVIDSWDYLNMDINEFMDPYFVPVPRDQPGGNYVLLTRRTSGLNTLGNLKGKDIVRLEMGQVTMGKPWLETLLLVDGFAVPEDFFNQMNIVGKPSLAVLPVFFGNKHACLVNQLSFETMKELNPQVGARLQAIAVSERFVDNVIFLAKEGWKLQEPSKLDLVEVLGDLHREPAGQQILSLFKIMKLLPFQESHIEAVRKLRARNDRFQEKLSP